MTVGAPKVRRQRLLMRDLRARLADASCAGNRREAKLQPTNNKINSFDGIIFARHQLRISLCLGANKNAHDALGEHSVVSSRTSARTIPRQGATPRNRAGTKSPICRPQRKLLEDARFAVTTGFALGLVRIEVQAGSQSIG